MTAPEQDDRQVRDRLAVGDRLRESMRALSTARRAAPEVATAKHRVRVWQNRRFADTYADLRAQPRYRPAVEFFLVELYGEADLSVARDADIERVLPVMVKMLPAPALETILDALVFETLCEVLDGAVAAELGNARLTVSSYADAFRRAGRGEERRRQIAYVSEIGRALDRLTRWPMIGTTLKVMRAPARAANLAALQSFLERGFVAFKHMHGADAFLATITERETALVERLFAGDPSPFELEDES
jgi:hypothetical protein